MVSVYAFVVRIIFMVYNPVISGLYTPARTDEMVYNPVISGLYTPKRFQRINRYAPLLFQGFIHPTQAYSIP